MPNCLLCKSNRVHLYTIKKIIYSYYLCYDCYTVFLYPSPSLNKINSLYKNNFDYSSGKTEEKRIRNRARSILKKLKRLNPEGQTLLDIGSGYGFFLDEAYRTGLKVTGVEPSSINRFKKNTVVRNNFQNYYLKYPSKKYDFIVLIHVIEHLFNPESDLKKAYSLLNDGGVLYLETPNLSGWLFKAEGKDYTFLTPPDHIWIFSLKSLMLLTSRLNGIKDILINTYSYPEHFIGIIRRFINRKKVNSLKINPRNNKIEQRNPLQKQIKLIIFDRFLATLFFRLIDIGHKGTFLGLYIRKKR